MNKTMDQAKKELQKLVLDVDNKLPFKIQATHSKRPEWKFKTSFLVVAFMIFTYLLLDCYLYFSIQTGSLFNQKVSSHHWHSPFYPLTVKLIMSDHFDHYAFTPISDWFNRITQFSHLFPFITPNLISLTHFCITLISFRFFISESLRSRRIGVLLFEIRCLLDSFDGVVYRARSSNKIYTSHRNEFGYYVDTGSDSLAGLVLYLGILFHYIKCPPTKYLTHCTQYENPTSDIEQNGPYIGKPPFTKFLFWRHLCVGLAVIVSSLGWDGMIKTYETLLQTPGKSDHLQHLQTKAFHQTSTFFIMWLWKITNGGTIIQITLFAVFIDKAWDFFSYAQYVLLTFVIFVLLLTQWQLHEVHILLETTRTN